MELADAVDAVVRLVYARDLDLQRLVADSTR